MSCARAPGTGSHQGSPGEAGVEVGSLCWFPHLPRTLCISSAPMVMDLGWLQKGQGEVAFVSPIHHHIPVLLSMCTGELFIASLSWLQRGRLYTHVGSARLLFYTSHVIAGGVVLGARKG